MSEDSDDSEACAERDHSKKKWRVELSDEQLDILMRCSDFKDKVQRRLKRKAAVKRLQRSGKKLRRGSRKSRVVSSSSSDSDSSEEESRKETMPLSKPNNNQEKDVLGDIDELLKDSGDETTPVVTTPVEDWKTRARILDEWSLKRVSRRFSAELEELNGNARINLSGNMSNGSILQLTAESMTMRARKVLPSEMPRPDKVRNLQGSSDKGFTNQISGSDTKAREARKSRKASDHSNLKPFLSQSYFIYNPPKNPARRSGGRKPSKSTTIWNQTVSAITQARNEIFPKFQSPG